jgi:hypothetical protein
MACTFVLNFQVLNALPTRSPINKYEQISAKQICLAMLRAELFTNQKTSLCYQATIVKINNQKIEEIMLENTSQQLTTPEAYQNQKKLENLTATHVTYKTYIK